jgi:hypothetical protein
LSKNVTVITSKTIILPIVLYGCETWSLILRKEQRLGVFENKVLRRIFGPEGDEIIGGRRKLHSEKLYNVYSSENIIRMIKSKKMIRAENVAPLGRKGMHIEFLWKSQKERDH